MAFYSYKRVVYRDDYDEARKNLEKIEGEKYEDSVDYDGDAWIVVEHLLETRKNQLRQRDDLLRECSAWMNLQTNGILVKTHISRDELLERVADLIGGDE